jgi:hypothetical protein
MMGDPIAELEYLLGLNTDNLSTIPVEAHRARVATEKIRAEHDQLQAKCEHLERALRLAFTDGFAGDDCPDYWLELDECKDCARADEKRFSCWEQWLLKKTKQQPKPGQAEGCPLGCTCRLHGPPEEPEGGERG